METTWERKLRVGLLHTTCSHPNIVRSKQNWSPAIIPLIHSWVIALHNLHKCVCIPRHLDAKNHVETWLCTGWFQNWKTAMQPRCTRARNGVDGGEIGQSCSTEFDSSTDMTDLQILWFRVNAFCWSYRFTPAVPWVSSALLVLTAVSQYFLDIVCPQSHPRSIKNSGPS